MRRKAKQPVEINEYAETSIKCAARGLVGMAGLTESDLGDIEQALRLKLLKRLRSFDPSRSTYVTFVSFVIEKHAKQIIEDRTAKKRDPVRESFSLNEEVLNGDHEIVERGELMTRDDDKRLGGIDEQGRVDMAIDVNAMLARLPRKTRKMLEMVKALPIPEAARRLGLVEITLRKRLVALRGMFRRAGLGDYLRNRI